MPPIVTQVAEHFQSVILTFAIILITGNLIAYIAAVQFGESKKQRKLIFTSVSLVFIVISVFVAQWMLRTPPAFK